MRGARLSRLRAALALLLLGSLGACATLTESTQQTVYVQTVQDHVEVVGVGCVLSNKVGRWFVTTPGRVAVQKSYGDLTVDCKKEGTGSAGEVVPSHVTSLWGNVVVSAGLGYFVDKQTGAGFDYPATLTVVLSKPPPKPETGPAVSGNQVF